MYFSSPQSYSFLSRSLYMSTSPNHARRVSKRMLNICICACLRPPYLLSISTACLLFVRGEQFQWFSFHRVPSEFYGKVSGILKMHFPGLGRMGIQCWGKEDMEMRHIKCGPLHICGGRVGIAHYFFNILVREFVSMVLSDIRGWKMMSYLFCAWLQMNI